MSSWKSSKRIIWALGILLLIGAFVFITSQVDSTTTIGFLGVLLGASISAVTSILLARESFHLQLATAALDKRLAVHQEAYAIWRKVLFNVHNKNEINAIVIDAQKWWENNCLYLDAQSRSAFSSCLLYANNHYNLNQRPLTPENEKILYESWEAIEKPGKTIVEGVALPSLGEIENGLSKEEKQKLRSVLKND